MPMTICKIVLRNIRKHGLEAPCYEALHFKIIIHIKIPNRTPVCIHIIADDEGRIGIVEDVEGDVCLYIAEPEVPAIDAGLEGVFVEGEGKFEAVAFAVSVEIDGVFACGGDDFAVFAGA